MKRKLLKNSSLLILLAAVVSLTACRKSASPKADPSESAENNAFAEAQYNDVTTMVDQAAINNTVLLGAAGSGSVQNVLGPLGSNCATVTVDTSSSPRSITIDFGSVNCDCLDGRTRRGKILATYSGRYRDAGTVITISFDKYYVNDHAIAGTKKITNQGPNQAGKLVYKVEVTGTVTKPDNGGTYSWNSTRFREWKEGASTILNILDDVYAITGEASGVNADGSSYTITVTKELIRKMNCRWFESGTLELVPSGLPKITLDYGSTGCDANATVTILGTAIPVLLD